MTSRDSGIFFLGGKPSKDGWHTHANVTGHLLLVGTTGKGRTSNGLPPYLPTPEELVTRLMNEEAWRAREKRQLDAVREAYWTHAEADDWGRLHDVLVEAGLDHPTLAQVKALFFLFDAPLVGKVIAWGPFDTEIGDDALEVAVEHLETLRAIAPPNA
jgi:hypothetical protein